MNQKFLSPYAAIYPAGNDTYHAIRSISEFGEFAHAAAYASQLISDGRAQYADEALMQASAELRRIRYAREGYAPHKKARSALKKHTKSIDMNSKHPALQASPSSKKESEK